MVSSDDDAVEEFDFDRALLRDHSRLVASSVPSVIEEDWDEDNVDRPAVCEDGAAVCEQGAAVRSWSRRLLVAVWFDVPCEFVALVHVVDNISRRPGTERASLKWLMIGSVPTILSAYSWG